MARERAFASAEERARLLAPLPKQSLLQEALADLVEQEEAWRSRLVRLAQQQAIICRLVELPGVSWIRGATLYAFLDTPWRFRSKQALWKYLGIGLQRRRSGVGPERLGVPYLAHRLLKSAILGCQQRSSPRPKSRAGPGRCAAWGSRDKDLCYGGNTSGWRATCLDER